MPIDCDSNGNRTFRTRSNLENRKGMAVCYDGSNIEQMNHYLGLHLKKTRTRMEMERNAISRDVSNTESSSDKEDNPVRCSFDLGRK